MELKNKKYAIRKENIVGRSTKKGGKDETQATHN